MMNRICLDTRRRLLANAFGDCCAIRRTLLPLLCVLLLARPAPMFGQGQDSATLLGTVVDGQKGALPGVAITARNVDTGFTRSTVTDNGGSYRLPAVLPGRYEVSAVLSGFETSIRTGVNLSLGAQAVLDFELNLASVAETLTVTADAPIIETTTGSVGITVRRDQVDALPSISRNYQDFLRLAPGTVNTVESASFGGSRGRSNQWQIDGVDNRSDLSGQERQTPPLESIQEFQLLVNSYKAEFGQASGGVVNAVTRSGTNELHGLGFLAIRDDSFVSRSPYDNRALRRDPFNLRYFGGTVGGPVVVNKLHYFATAERRVSNTFAASTFTLPSATAAFSPSTRTFLQSHGVDLGLFGAGGVQRLTRPTRDTEDKLSVRIDQQFSPRQFLTVRYLFNRPQTGALKSNTLLDFNATTLYQRQHYATASLKRILSNTALNELAIQVGQTYQTRESNFPNFPNISVSGAFSLGGDRNFPQQQTQYVYQIRDALTWNAADNKHAIKVGADVKVYRADGQTASGFLPQFTFPTLQRFLDGQPSRFDQTRGDPAIRHRNVTTGLYVQDDWAVSNALTLNLGVRYDYESAKRPPIDPSLPQEPGISGDKNNVGPRLGFSWAPGGRTTQAFYGGTGVYYDQVIMNNFSGSSFTPPKQFSVIIDNPSFPTADNPFQVPLSSVRLLDPELEAGYNINSSLGYRRELTTDIGLDVSFIYNRGWNHMAVIDLNPGIEGTANLTGAGAIRADRTVLQRLFYSGIGDMTYKALFVNVTKRMSHNVQAAVAYTMSRTRDNTFNLITQIQVPSHPELNMGPGNNDIRHILVVNSVVRLPWGFQLGAILEARTEAPLNIFAGGRDLNGDGITNDWVNESICQNITCQGFTYSRNSVRELSTEEANRLRALLGLPAIAAFADNPKFVNLDAALQKRFTMGRHHVTLSIQAVNVLNLPQRTAPVSNIVDGAFGRHIGVVQPRAAQFTLRYGF
jgi:hypothetical protein